MATKGFTKTKFKTIKLTEGDATFVYYVLRMYAAQAHQFGGSEFTQREREEIREVASKFKID